MRKNKSIKRECFIGLLLVCVVAVVVLAVFVRSTDRPSIVRRDLDTPLRSSSKPPFGGWTKSVVGIHTQFQPYPPFVAFF
jgi:hypothetical protein